MSVSIALKDSATFVIQQGDNRKKVFKFFFLKDKTDFYIAFPYLKISSYRCGKRNFVYGVEKTVSTVEDAQASSIPVKFSYHESGWVHFKPVNPGVSPTSSSLKLAELKATPIHQFTGEHVFTIHIEGLQHFDDFTAKDEKKNPYVICDIPSDREQVKIVGYVGFSDAEIGGKYSNQPGGDIPTLTVTFTRPHLPTPLKIGIYVLTGESMNKDEAKKPYILSLVGFKMNDKRDEVETLFLHASSIE